MTKRQATQQLPQFIEPMLAKAGVAFDSDDHLFEVKWDGTRTLVFIEHGTYRLVNRRQIDTTNRYPELEFLKTLPSGSVLDGEIVVMHDGRPDFPRLLGRENCRSELKIRLTSRATPVTFIAFDQLYRRHQSLMGEQLVDRREQLYQTASGIDDRCFVVSEGVVGCGKLLFEQTSARDLEGIVAKRLASRYQPGKRSDAWIKVKRRSKLPCVVVGFVPDGRNDLQNLLLAAQTRDGLRYVGSVGTGLSDRLRASLSEQLRAIVVDRPVVPCRGSATWVEPEIYCWVSYMELTRSGEMRDPVFEDLITEPIGA